MFSSIYRLLTDWGAPLIGLYLRRRLAAGREDGARMGERRGQPSQPRPDGAWVWCHAASVGEAVSLLPLIDRLHEAHPDIHVLLTTGTVTAARMMEDRLPSYAVHQYAPVDRAPYIKSFLDHWRPQLALWIESEIWPNTIRALHDRAIPTVLLNARISERSFRRWHRVKGWARQLMGSFSLCLAQTENDRGRFVALGAKPVKCIGNLKYASAPLPFDAVELARLKGQITWRPLWLMASTHRGEDEMALTAHREIALKHPGLLTVIAPRHAARGDEIARLCAQAELNVARRSKGEAITPATQIYLADTMGELGLFYSLCPVAVIGGSFVRVGGHNPIEAAQLGAAIIVGPFMHNFAEIAREFTLAQASMALQHGNEIAFAVDHLLTQPEEAARQAQAARLLANHKRHILDQILDEIEPWLKRQ